MFGMNVKKMFFDRKAVRRRVDKAARRVLSRFGAFVRTTARHSIRKRKRVSRPGEPPSSHTGSLRRLIFFGYDPGRKSVVIGPVPLRSASGRDVPETLEYSGRATIIGGPRRKRRKRRVKIAARPFMGPAMAKEKPKLSAMWAGSIR